MAAGLNVFKKRKSEKLNFTSFLVLSRPINSVFHIRVTFVTGLKDGFLETYLLYLSVFVRRHDAGKKDILGKITCLLMWTITFLVNQKLYS